MESILLVITPFAMGLVVIVLIAGLWNMLKDGSPNRSQSLMRMRVVLQFVAIIIALGVLLLAGR